MMVGTVISADLDVIGQMPPGTKVRFVAVDLDQHVQALAPPAHEAGHRDRRLVHGLVREDFTVFDEGREQPIAVFDNEVQPVTVVVMLDTSLSMAGSMDLLLNAAEQFLIRLLPADRAVVGAFNDKIQFEEFEGVFSSDRDALMT